MPVSDATYPARMRRVRFIVSACALLAAWAAPPAFAGTLDGLTDAQIAARFAPRLVLHADERYAPTSADELLALGASLVNRCGAVVRPAPLSRAVAAGRQQLQRRAAVRLRAATGLRADARARPVPRPPALRA